MSNIFSRNQIMVINAKQNWKRNVCHQIVTNGAPLHNPLHWFHLICKFAGRLTQNFRLVGVYFFFPSPISEAFIRSLSLRIFFSLFVCLTILFNCGTEQMCIDNVMNNKDKHFFFCACAGTKCTLYNLIDKLRRASEKKRTNYVAILNWLNWLSLTGPWDKATRRQRVTNFIFKI